MSAAEAIRKREMFEEVDRALASLGVQPNAAVRYWVPGRIEVLGKHTDYAGGRSLLCAIERGFCFAAIPRPVAPCGMSGASAPASASTQARTLAARVGGS